MEFQNIHPFVRFVRYLELTEETNFCAVFPSMVIPMDARLFYVTDGDGLIECAGKTYDLPKHSIFYINTGVPYHILPKKVTYLAVNFDFDQCRADHETPIPPVRTVSAGSNKAVPVNFTDAVCFNECFMFENCRSLQHSFIALESEYSKKLPYYHTKTSSELSIILTELLRISSSRQSSVASGRFDIEQVIAYIHEHYSEDIDNMTLSELFHFHPNYISSEFKRCIGVPLHRYVLETRILKAISLMESGMGLEETASLTGFCDVNYFSRYFKQVMRVSPGKYIKGNSI